MEDKEQIIKEIFGEYEGIVKDSLLSADTILDLTNPVINDDSMSKKLIDLILALELDVDTAVRPVNGVTAPFIVAVLEGAIDKIKSRYPVESKFSHYAAAIFHHWEGANISILSGSQIENYHVLDTVFKKGATKQGNDL